MPPSYPLSPNLPFLASAYAIVRGAVLGKALPVSKHTDPEVRTTLVTFDSALCTVLLIAGFPAMAEKATNRAAAGMANLELFGAWVLYLYQAGGYFGLGLYDRAIELYRRGIEEAKEVGHVEMRMQYSTFLTQLYCHALQLDEANRVAADLLAIHQKESIPLQWRGWALVQAAVATLFSGDEEALLRCVSVGEEYVKMITSEEYSKQVGDYDWAGDVHVLALSWLRRHGQAAAMVIAMVDDDRKEMSPGNVGRKGGEYVRAFGRVRKEGG